MKLTSQRIIEDDDGARWETGHDKAMIGGQRHGTDSTVAQLIGIQAIQAKHTVHTHSTYMYLVVATHQIFTVSGHRARLQQQPKQSSIFGIAHHFTFYYWLFYL